MGKWMSERGVGRGLWVLLAGLAMLSCATSSAEGEPEAGVASAAPADGVKREPERVVQRIVPAPDRAANAGSPKASSSPTERRPSEPISSKHLEAELNRLEAELGK